MMACHRRTLIAAIKLSSPFPDSYLHALCRQSIHSCEKRDETGMITLNMAKCPLEQSYHYLKDPNCFKRLVVHT